MVVMGVGWGWTAAEFFISLSLFFLVRFGLVVQEKRGREKNQSGIYVNGLGWWGGEKAK